MSRRLGIADLDTIPRLGLVDRASPVTELPALAGELGIDFLGVKRDDLIDALYGGNKPRKLDYLLAAPPLDQAPRWAALGAIGSGNVVALAAAAGRLGRQLDAHLFWEPLSAGVVDNLAYTASHAAKIYFYRGRVAAALRRPAIVRGGRTGGAEVVPVGSTSPHGMLGSVRAGLEIAEQVAAGELPAPDRVYVALGTGGTAVGLGVGLGMGGLSCEVVAVAVVERVFISRRRVLGLMAAVQRELERLGVAAAGACQSAPIRIVRGQLGRGYARVTAESLTACQRLHEHGIELEPIYTGKAMAALLTAERAGGRVLLVNTRHGGGLPSSEGWRDRLPRRLRRRLALAEDPRTPGRRIRRRLLLGTGLVVAGAGAAVRVSGYRPLPGFDGQVLAAWEARVVLAVAEVVLPFASATEIGEVVVAIDTYLVALPAGMRRDLHNALALLEHGTLLEWRWHRFTALDRTARDEVLAALGRRHDLLVQIYDGFRELVMLGYYQQRSSFAAIGYDGPLVAPTAERQGPARMAWPAYDDMVAPAGRLPKGVVE